MMFLYESIIITSSIYPYIIAETYLPFIAVNVCNFPQGYILFCCQPYMIYFLMLYSFLYYFFSRGFIVNNFLIPPLFNHDIFTVFISWYHFFSGSLKLVFDDGNDCLNFITNILYIPKLYPKYTQFFHYVLHMIYIWHVI